MDNVQCEPQCQKQLDQFQELRHREISDLAYKKWQEAGEPQGDGVQFWLDAEREWEEDFWIPVHSEHVVCEGGSIKNPTNPCPDNPNLPWRERVRRFWARWANQ